MSVEASEPRCRVKAFRSFRTEGGLDDREIIACVSSLARSAHGDCDDCGAPMFSPHKKFCLVRHVEARLKDYRKRLTMKTRHVDSTSPERTRRALAYGRIKGRERAMVDLRDDEGPVSEIMRAATEVEMAYHDLGRFATKPHLDRWLAARLELRKVASRIVYGMDDR